MITVRLPAMLRVDDGSDELVVDEAVATVGQLVAALDRLRPGLGARLQDSLFNFAVNDALVLHGADDYPLQPGDTVEVIPTIAGG
jgi:molybdopterin converting factor small subunit